jgi:hypothetical protein
VGRTGLLRSKSFSLFFSSFFYSFLFSYFFCIFCINNSKPVKPISKFF